ncbi:MAG TPA: SDR family NAD(P)-dependent oxidoreductase, partial [Acidimicrobiia bacterium]|nr:SDR family NAD(P)-dependent oxidoreductase [Acidimicrobiia bacterium]
MVFRGRVAVVTGASSGIGAAIATDLAGRGARVVAVARRAERLAEVVETCRVSSPDSIAQPADVSSRPACDEIIAATEARFGRVDILVNNAGISIHKNAARTSVEEIERLMAVNFFAPVYLSMAALPGMLERRD